MLQLVCMKTLQTKIQSQVSTFVGNIQKLVHEATVEELERAFGVKANVRRNGRHPGAKRPPEVLDNLAEELYQRICVTPGETMAVLSGALGCKSTDLIIPVRRLISQGKVKKTGERQSSRYFPLGGRGSVPGKFKKKRKLRT